MLPELRPHSRRGRGQEERSDLKKTKTRHSIVPTIYFPGPKSSGINIDLFVKYQLSLFLHLFNFWSSNPSVYGGVKVYVQERCGICNYSITESLHLRPLTDWGGNTQTSALKTLNYLDYNINKIHKLITYLTAILLKSTKLWSWKLNLKISSS